MKRLTLAGIAALSLVVWQTMEPLGSIAAEPDGDAEVSEDAPDRAAAGVALQWLSDAEVQDLLLMAEQHDLSLDEAIERYGWNNDFATAVTQARDASPETFADAKIVDSGHAWVSFTGDAPREEALDAVRGFIAAHPDVSVEVRPSARFSEADKEKAVSAAHYAVLGADEVVSATTSLDTDRKVIAVLVVGDGGIEQRLDHLRAIAVDAIAKAGAEHVLDTVEVTVEVSKESVTGGVDSNTEHIGGELLNGPGCTSGFVVQNEEGTRGVATAGHCDGAMTDDGVALAFRQQHIGLHGDVEWRTGPQPRPPDFYAGNVNATEVNRRKVNEVNAPVVGQALCKNGRTNHAQCQEVRRIGVCADGTCGLVQMGARLAAAGDSGGPVYWGHTAYGLHQGWHYDPTWPFDRDLFSRADRLPDALGVAIVK